MKKYQSRKEQRNVTAKSISTFIGLNNVESEKSI